MDNIHFSVITVVRNDINGLVKTRKSLEQQEYPNWIHIIIDCESTDGIREFLESLPLNNTIFISEKDSGIYNAMNKGWALAPDTSYTYFLNARDVFCSVSALTHAASALSESNSPDWGCTTHEEISEDQSLWICKRVAHPTVANQLFATGYRSHQSVVMKKKFLENLGGFNEEYRIASDWDLIVRAILRTQPITWMQSLGRFELGGMSEKNLLDAHIELMSLREKYLPNNLRQRMLDKIWCAIYLQSLGHKNLFSKILLLSQVPTKRKEGNSRFKIRRGIEINLFLFIVAIRPNIRLYFRLIAVLQFNLKKLLGINF